MKSVFMMKTDKRLIYLAMLVSILLWTQKANALEHPVYYWDVQGVVKDWSTKKPVVNARILVFLDRSPHMNFGFNPEQTDYPDLPKTSEEGRFKAKAVLYRTPPKTRPDQIEVIVLAPDYRTERFEFPSSKVRFIEETNGGGALQIPEIEVGKYEDLIGDHLLVSDPQTAEKLARLAIERNHVDTSGQNMDKTESIQEITWNGRSAWRVSFGRQEQAKGGQIVVSIDAKTGKAEIGWGE